MNLKYKKPLLLAIVAGMGLVPFAGAFATPLNLAPDSTTGTAEPLYFPTEAKESSADYFSAGYGTVTNSAGGIIKDGGDLDVYIYTMPGYAVKVGEQKTLVVKVSLTGGAKFNKAPVLICPQSGNDGAASPAAETRDVNILTWTDLEAATDVTAVLDNGGKTGFFLVAINPAASQASYSFAFPEGFVIPQDQSGACILSLTASDPAPAAAAGFSDVSMIKGVAGADVNMNVEVTYDEFFTKVTKTATIPIISFATAYKATISTTNLAATTAAYGLIDVGSLSKKFISGTEPTLQAFVGHVIVSAVDIDKTFRNASGVTLSAGNLIESATITVSGPTIAGLSKISFNSADATTPTCASTTLIEGKPATVTTSGTTSGSAPSGGVGSVTVTVTGGTTWSEGYSQLVSDDGGGAGRGIIVCTVADGNTPMSNGYLSIVVNGTSPAGKVTELGSASDYLEVKRNGTAIRVLNIPLESTDPYKVNIRMFNVSNLDLTGVKGSLYGVDGALIKDDLDLGTVPANGVKLVTSDSVIGMLGTGSTAKGRAWMLIQAPVQDTFKVQVLMKNPSGVLSNISTDAAD